MNHRKKCAGKNKDFHEPKTQSFMKRQDFNDINKIFTRDSKFQIKNGNRNNLYRSKIKMNIYDVQLKNGVPYVVHRCDYVVAGLDNNGYPVHYEPVTRDIAEQFPVETMSKYMETEETDAPKELKVASMTAIRELSDMIATGEGIAMTADGGCSISEDDESLPGDGTTPVGGDKTLVGDGATQFGVFNNLFQGFNNLFQGFTSLFQGLATLFQGIIDLFSGGMTPVGGAPKKPSATTVATTVAVAVPVPTTAVRKETNVTVAMTVATTAVGKETSVTTAATVAATAVIEGTHMTVATTPFEKRDKRDHSSDCSSNCSHRRDTHDRSHNSI
ncbi:hypothetical protein ROHU_030290 [Labeo rohita]|uniref:Uncharacterized protein n=2 Tax=Labeo rohita TaxID=84645 RepID=A0A498M130_LABRO|nr:hypothetical protein ROHU_030290 [Labeo rohita]